MKEIPKHWRCIAAVVLPVAVVAVVYWSAASTLFSLWLSSETYSHSLLVAPLSLYFIYRVSRASPGFVCLSPSLLALAVAFVSGALWFVGFLSNTILLEMLAIPPLVWCANAFLIRRQDASNLLGPVGLLMLCVPIWDYAAPVLQAAAAVAVGYILDMVAVPALIDGNMIHVGAGSFEVAEGCSGLHYFIVAISIALIGALEMRCGRLETIGLLAASVLLSVLANWVRITVIVLVGDATDMQHYLVREEHYYFGWFVFALFMAPIAVYLWKASTAEAGEPSAAIGKCTEGGGQVDRSADRDRQPSSRFGPALSLLGACFFFGYPLWAYSIERQELSAGNEIDWMAPKFDQYVFRPASDEASPWRPVFVGADVIRSGSYIGASGTFDVFVAIYADEEQGEELVGYNNQWFDESTIRVLSQELATLTVQNQSAQWRRVLASSADTARLIVHAYVVDGDIIANAGRAKLARLIQRVQGGGPQAAVYVSTDATQAEAAAPELYRVASVLAEALLVDLEWAG